MSWRPGTGADVAQQRAALQERVRAYFSQNGVLAVDTPALSSSAVSDPAIRSLSVINDIHPGAPLFLHTSPEFAMKRLLADAYPDIYSICRVFRGGECGHQHQPEFTMVEWYRLGFSLEEIVDDCLHLIAHTLDRPELESEACRMSYSDAFVEATGIDPLSCDIGDLVAAAGADADLCRALGDDRQQWLDLLFSTRVCDIFPGNQLTVVTHFPAAQAALARLTPDGKLAERFEVFAGALELANGYVELTDEQELRRRFDGDLETRKQRGEAIAPLDQRFLDAMGAGLPDCAGVALGFERLHMLHAGAKHIRDVLTFEFEGETT